MKKGRNGEGRGSRKRWLIFLIVLAAVMAACVIIWRARAGENHSSGTPGGSEIEGSYNGDETATPYFGGVVEAQQTVSIQKDSDRQVKDVFVSAGDSVTAGQKLFSYDTADTQSSLDQAKLELSGYGTDIADYQNQIADLTSKRNASTDPSEKADYTDQINELHMEIRQSTLSQQTKQVEIQGLEKKITDSTVTSPIDGVVKQINVNGSGSGDGSSDAYLTILSTGAYQIKGTVDELNVSSLTQGMKAVIHSRTDDKTWTGTISKIDTEPVKSADASMGGSSSGEESDQTGQASRYNFYVTLDSSEGLLLGQHVYIEPQYDDADADKENTKEETSSADSVTGDSDQDTSANSTESTAQGGDSQ